MNTNKKMYFSFIDFSIRGFLKDEKGEQIIIEAESRSEVDKWMSKNLGLDQHCSHIKVVNWNTERINYGD